MELPWAGIDEMVKRWISLNRSKGRFLRAKGQNN
jgi:hypothetical protein